MAAATVLYETLEGHAERTREEHGDLWIPLADLASLTGWELKPEGVCKDEICVPVPDARRASLNSDGLFNLGEFARMIEQPVAHEDRSSVWYFGAPVWEWKARLTSREAPDFALPDLRGDVHTLAELRGSKVFLLFWATW